MWIVDGEVTSQAWDNTGTVLAVAGESLTAFMVKNSKVKQDVKDSCIGPGGPDRVLLIFEI